jgi:hypothetical protein
MRPEHILPSCSFGNTFYYGLLLNEKCIVDTFENYLKQTWRNRYDILGANGKLTLTVPVLGQKGAKIPTKEIYIDNQLLWQRNHLRSIIAAYGSSPYFEHYIDQISSVFSKKYDLLIDFNQEAARILWEILQVKEPIIYSKHYIEKDNSAIDLRPYFKPARFKLIKKETTSYLQTFADKFNFIPNLSILDMVFNLGPEVSENLRTHHFKAGQFVIFDPQ